MDWILVVITFMNPAVDMKTVEVRHHSQEACQQALNVLEHRYSKIDGLGYILTCRLGDEDASDE